MFWASFGHVSGIIQTCFGHHSDILHALGIIQTCCGHHSDMLHALGIIQTCFGSIRVEDTLLDVLHAACIDVEHFKVSVPVTARSSFVVVSVFLDARCLPRAIRVSMC